MSDESEAQRVRDVCFEALCYAVEIVVVSRLHETLTKSLGFASDRHARVSGHFHALGAQCLTCGLTCQFKLATPRLEKIREVDLPPWKSRPHEPVVLEIIWYYREPTTGERRGVSAKAFSFNSLSSHINFASSLSYFLKNGNSHMKSPNTLHFVEIA